MFNVWSVNWRLERVEFVWAKWEIAVLRKVSDFFLSGCVKMVGFGVEGRVFGMIWWVMGVVNVGAPLLRVGWKTWSRHTILSAIGGSHGIWPDTYRYVGTWLSRMWCPLSDPGVCDETGYHVPWIHTPYVCQWRDGVGKMCDFSVQLGGYLWGTILVVAMIVLRGCSSVELR